MSKPKKNERVGGKMNRLVVYFNDATRNRVKFTEDQKRLSAEIVARHAHRGLRFVVKIMVDYGLVSKTTYDRDCMCVRRAIHAHNR